MYRHLTFNVRMESEHTIKQEKSQSAAKRWVINQSHTNESYFTKK